MTSRTALFILTMAVATPAPALQRPVITSGEQLPRRTYQVAGTVQAILADDAQLRRLSQDVLTNLEQDLKTLDIRDNATLAAYHSNIAILHALLGQPAQARARIPVMRELESKPATRLTTGLFLDAWARAKEQAPDESSPAFRAAFESLLAASYRGLPYDQIREHVETSKAQASMVTVDLVMGSVMGVQNVLDKTNGVLTEGALIGLLGTKFMLAHRLPLKNEMLKVYTAVSDANRASAAPKADIWAERNVVLAPGEVDAPVVIAIWDSGVDMDVIPLLHRFVNRAEVKDGKDNDGNGHVDDVHGIAYDRSAAVVSAGTLEDPAGKISGDVTRLQRLTKGGLDLQSGIQSAEARELQQTVAGLKPADVQRFLTELNFYTGYMHGTHVAGIAFDGNPGARILAARQTMSVEPNQPPHTMDKARFNARMYRDTVGYFAQHGVRVVNMSWRYNAASIEASLASNGVGKDAADRRALAQAMFDVERDALYEAIKAAPGILFVCGSGNENNDADFSRYIPASFDLPNLITVGAVDAAGYKTSFTTEGRSVDFYASGHEVESYVPGGARLKISGTSMASPQVANLAAKLLAVKPALTPGELVTLMRDGSDPAPENPALRLINPKKTLALVKKEK